MGNTAKIPQKLRLRFRFGFPLLFRFYFVRLLIFKIISCVRKSCRNRVYFDWKWISSHFFFKIIINTVYRFIIFAISVHSLLLLPLSFALCYFLRTWKSKRVKTSHKPIHFTFTSHTISYWCCVPYHSELSRHRLKWCTHRYYTYMT